ncbi:hypothetical protein [Streptomyces sp. NPDC002676]
MNKPAAAPPDKEPHTRDPGPPRDPDPKPTIVLAHGAFADASGRVNALVSIAAFTPDKGESAAQLAAGFPGSTLGDTVNAQPYPLPGGRTGTELVIVQAEYRRQFAAARTSRRPPSGGRPGAPAPTSPRWTRRTPCPSPARPWSPT